MKRRNPHFDVVGSVETEKLIDDLHEGLKALVESLESQEFVLSDEGVRDKLRNLDHHSQRLLRLISGYEPENGARNKGRFGISRFKTGHRFIQQIDLLVEQNLDNHKFGVNELARAMGMSRSQIHRKLTSLTEQSANCYIRNYRLHRAARMLRESAYNVSDIAYQVGFGSQTYFSKCFREIFMMSPTAYRSTFEKRNKKGLLQ